MLAAPVLSVQISSSTGSALTAGRCWTGLASLQGEWLPDAPRGVSAPCPAATILHRPRALNSRLGNDKPGQTFGLRLQDWRSALTLCLEAMKT